MHEHVLRIACLIDHKGLRVISLNQNKTKNYVTAASTNIINHHKIYQHLQKPSILED